MSVSNVVFEKHRIRLISDTCSYRGKKPAEFHRKVSLIEDTNVALTTRGRVVIADFLREASEASAWADLSFEGIIEQAAIALRCTSADAIDSGAEATFAAMVEGEAKVARLMVTSGDDGIRVDRIDLAPGVYLGPSLGAHAIPATLTNEQILKIAFLQQSLAKKHGLNMCIGGDVELTTLDAEGARIEKIGEYPDKALMAKMMERNSRGARRAVAA